MTREEWYESADFKLLRLLSQHVHGLLHQAQQVGDVLELVECRYPDATVTDKYTLVATQLRLIHSELRRLVGYSDDLTRRLTPSIEEEPRD